MLEHGGNLFKASQKYNLKQQDWLDLSTGINPNGWAVPVSLPAKIWSHLPIENDGLLEAAQAYYDCDDLLAVAGSQAAIQALPRLRKYSRVGILAPAYAEHGHAWRQAGHVVVELDSSAINDALPELDVLVIINPNNPTAEQFSPSQLLLWHQQLAHNGGWLLVDEAFIDCTPEYSLVDNQPLEGLIILRSIGKFFGLAGLRIGFVFATAELLDELAELLGPWPIAQASRYITKLALTDTDWQQQQRQVLPQSGQRLNALLTRYNLSPTAGCALFQWVRTTRAEQWYQLFAQQGIFTRLFKQPASLRFGLPESESDWQRLTQTLEKISRP
jgi:cobalamin biosynthetic protein CobC